MLKDRRPEIIAAIESVKRANPEFGKGAGCSRGHCGRGISCEPGLCQVETEARLLGIAFDLRQELHHDQQEASDDT